MNKTKLYKNLLIVAALCILLVIGMFSYLNSSPISMDNVIVSVSYGASISSVAHQLKINHCITSKNFFKVMSLTRGRRTLKSGRYELYRGMTTLEIIDKMTKGNILTSKVTIPEGFNIFQIGKRLESKKICSSAKFIFFAQNRNFLRSRDIDFLSAEGYLFPDTYVFAIGSDARDIIAAMHRRMIKILKNEKENYRTKMDDHEILILASLIEKEARVKSEQRFISSVFHNRLKLNMRLDCDPTVRYAVKRFKGPIYYKDLRSRSLYNTYKYKGLPPTPIASPGKKAIAAALNPVESGYLYFVARNNGSHYFSKNLKEHNRAVQYYQRGKKNGFIDSQKLTE